MDWLKEFARRFDQMAMDRLMGASTTNSVASGTGPLTLEKLNNVLKDLGPPLPRRNGAIIESTYMVDRFEDWSKARSPSRTRRRMRYNAARIYTYKPKTSALLMPDGSFVMHPVAAQHLRLAIKSGDKSAINFGVRT